ncbi:MAG: DUF72 domain-containing protein [Candidatus Aminicenantaceae bacterium]
MTEYYTGTAGWSYKDWEGLVYPLKRESNFHPLVFLAQYINVVEINSTFYRAPAVRMALSWTKKIENYPSFIFSVKLHQIFTHQRKDFSQKDIDNFKLGIEPLHVKNRLACILLQFPWSFINTQSHMDYLVRLFNYFSDYPLALEVRHSSWNNSDFFKFLSDYRVCFCNIDQPIFKNSIEPSSIVTHPDFSYLRLHGRNYRTWFKKNAGRDERYNYLYQKEELDDLVKKIKDLGNQSKKVITITNNHYRGQALTNALQIKNMISGEKVDIPKLLLKQYPVLNEIVKKIDRGQLDLFNDK